MSRIIVGEFLMVGDLSSEVVHCPNCKEDVPKTLYCLNCGYPLYKIEQKKEEAMVEPEPDILEVVAPEEEEADMGVEIEQPVEPAVVEEEPEPAVEETVEEVTIEVEEPEVEAIEEPEALEEPTEAEPEPKYVLEEEAQVVEAEGQEEAEETATEAPEEPIPEPEEPIPVPEEEQAPEPEEPPLESIVEPAPEPTPEPEVVTLEPEKMEEIIIEFAPDPLTKEVMDNLAKNITLKIRLVKLLRESQVKEETFKKLFDSYVEQGKIWVSRRDEILKRFKTDIERMENALVTARKDHELLEIRKSIGDADADEYSVKAPAYKWDIEHLEKEIMNRKGGIFYVVNLKKLVPNEEIAELERMAEAEYSELEEIEAITQDTVAKMKAALAEAFNSLQA